MEIKKYINLKLQKESFLDAIYKNNQDSPQYKHEIQSIQKTEIGE